MTIPPDARVVRDSRLDAIRVISFLADRHVEAQGGLKDKVKTTMLDKSATYAESDLALGRVASTFRPQISAAKTHAFIKAGRITLDQFLDCVTVHKEPLTKHLSANELDEITEKVPCRPALFTEFKPSIVADPDHLASVLVQALKAPASRV